ncbi:MAG: DNA primase [Anaerolineae bacterium]
MSDIDLIKQKLDIVDLISETVKLRKSGRAFSGMCPFHQNTRTPAFYVFPDTQSWHCFGACSTGGDIFNFVMKRENLEFADALKLLATRAGVELHRESSADDSHKLLLEIQQAAASYFHYLLLHHADAQYARNYIARRQIHAIAIENFQLGFSLKEWHSLQAHLVGKGYQVADIARAGLITPNETGGGYHDRFRGRLMFPIRNRRGETIGFGARTLGDDQPKYLNSPETPLFTKSEVLYGLDQAKDAIRADKLAVIVEGYTDVIIAHQEGFKNVIAAMGTALTERQLSQLQRLTKRYALALDADVAGAAATERGLELARQALRGKQVPIPVGPGMLSYQERLDAELLIIQIPMGRDPDEVILQDRKLWQDLVQHAVPLIDYYLQAQTRDLDLRNSDGRFEAIRRLLPVIAEMKDDIQRRHYAQELARLVREDERTILAQIETRLPNVKKNPTQSTAVPAAPLHPGAKYHEHLFSLILAYPALLSRVQFLAEEDFRDGIARELWRAFQRYNSTAAEFDADEFLDGLSGATRDEADRLRQAGKQYPFEEAEAARELEVAAYRMRLQHDRDELMQLQYALAEAIPAERTELEERAARLGKRIAEAQRALSRRTMLRNSSPLISWS